MLLLGGGGGSPCKGITCSKVHAQAAAAGGTCTECGGGLSSIAIVSIPVIPSLGVVRGGALINQNQVDLGSFPGMGDLGRRSKSSTLGPGGFDPFAGPMDYRGYFRLDFRQGIGIFRANPSCRAPGDCVAARPFYRYDDLDHPPPRGDQLLANLVSVSPRGRGVHIEYAFNESLYRAPAWITGHLTITAGQRLGPGSRLANVGPISVDNFPSIEIYQQTKSAVIPIFTQGEQAIKDLVTTWDLRHVAQWFRANI